MLPEGSLRAGGRGATRSASNVFYLALSLIIMGVGFLKPNISTIVGQLYPQGDPRRDPGFTLYYYGINLGSFWAVVLCGCWARPSAGGPGFGLAGVGMAGGLRRLRARQAAAAGQGRAAEPGELAKQPVAGPAQPRMADLPRWPARRRPGLCFLVPAQRPGRLALLGIGIVAVAGLSSAGSSSPSATKVERERMMLAMVLIFGAVVFFTLFEQAGSSLNLFADAQRRPGPDGHGGAPSWAIPSARAEQLAAAGHDHGRRLVDWIDTTLDGGPDPVVQRRLHPDLRAGLRGAVGLARRSAASDPNPILKFGLGLLQVGPRLPGAWSGRSRPGRRRFRCRCSSWPLLYLLHTTGELFLSPVGLSQITKLSRRPRSSLHDGGVVPGLVHRPVLGGIIAGLAGTETVGGQVPDPEAALPPRWTASTPSAGSASASAWPSSSASFFIAKWSNGVNEPGNHPGPTLTDGGKEDGNVAQPGQSTVG